MVNDNIEQFKVKISELNSSKNKLEHAIGLNTIIILSKDIFNKNEDINDYLKVVFDTSFLPYVIKSRTLIIAKVSRLIYSYDQKELNSLSRKMQTYFNIDNPQTESDKKNKDNNNLSKWIKGIKNER